ncbi:MFS transporter [Rhodococcus rhodochrous]|uniref:MFS transporter n=1 Tax=Rhodococcus rhodochrous TaxID=1829 RepID=UPI0007515805|nr:MFS transporter [Rhodococcus rhodochrous]MDO1485106.1 MFS transporter [Rhodococcus rhodochrous]SNV10096.1 MFS transporter [Rhodococcus rhodochrous]
MTQAELQAPSSQPRNSPAPRHYKWVVLAAGVFAQASAAMVLQGLPSLAPAFRSQYSLSLTMLGLVLAASTAGLLIALVPWGVLADRIGERWVMTIGLTSAATALVTAGTTDRVGPLIAALVAAGTACASVNAASGRAVLIWFPRAQRGFAMGARQTAIPLGAAIAALTLPAVESRWGLTGAFTTIAVTCTVAAVVVAALVRERPAEDPDGPDPATAPGESAADDRRTARWLCTVSALLVVPQIAIVSFMVVYLVDHLDVSLGVAAALLALVQFGGGMMRLILGFWSDRSGRRVHPLFVIASITALLFVVLVPATIVGGPVALVVLVCTGFSAVSWNGLAFTAVGELADRRRIGLMLGIQNTAVAAGMMLTPPALGALLDRTTWPAAFGAVAAIATIAVLVLSRLARTERERTLRP